MVQITETFRKLLQENKKEEALQYIFQAIEDDPTNDVHYINAGNLLFEQQMHQEAERFFRKALECNPDAATAYFSLGNLYYATSHYEHAEEMLKKAIELKLEDQDVYYLLGMTYVKRKLPLFALPFLQRAHELGTDIDITFQYGLTLAQVNYLQEAEKILQQVVAQDEAHVDALYNLGILYIHLDDLAAGKQYLEKTLAIQPEHSLAKQAIAHLQNESNRSC